MTCRSVRKKLSGYLDGTLHTREHRPVQDHVAVCPLAARTCCSTSASLS
jgi:hypothetical protein